MSIKNIKVSIITVVKNGMPYLEDCIKSFQLQDYKNKELIVVYSNSQDLTLSYLKKQKFITKLIIDNKSKNKFGALNIGLQNTSGDIIGIMHADDIFASNKVLSIVAKTYKKKKFDIGFGNIKFCLRNNLQSIQRIWVSSKHSSTKTYFGWMPPHVSIFISKKYKKLSYNSHYSISGDYEYILRIFKLAINVVHINVFFTVMRLGGVSNKYIFQKTKEDFLIAKKLIGMGYVITIFFKNLIKIPQVFADVRSKSYSYNQYIKKNFKSDVKLITHTKNLLHTKKFLLCARNLAFYSLVVHRINVLKRDLIVWQDGIFPFNSKFVKLPGRQLINKLSHNKDIDKIYVLAKKDKKNIRYLEKNFKSQPSVISLPIPYGNIDSIIKNFNKFKIHPDEKDIFLICIPTPKQEILGCHIMNRFENAKILCVGGALDYLSGNTKKPPVLFSGKLEFIWRLRNETFRRIFRLLLSTVLLIRNYWRSEFYNLNIKK